MPGSDRMNLHRIERFWYSKNIGSALLLPVSWVFRLGAAVHRGCYRLALIKPQVISVPVIVVGNISVGGTGKTPLVTWMVDYLRQRGYRPGIVSRGYGGKAKHWPQQVRQDSDPTMVGDEAVLLARRCLCPIAVGPDRVAAARALLEYTDCDIIVADDGLQHYRLHRDIEIAVVDGVRRFGNQRLLPAGPLREPVARLQHVDAVVVNGLAGRGEFSMKLLGSTLSNIASPQQTYEAGAFPARKVHAVAGIGNPKRFFEHLRKLGLEVIEHPFPDHHPYTAQDIAFEDDLPVIMTEKDAVKCQRFATPRHWVLPVTAEMQDTFEHRFNLLMKRMQHG